MFWERFCNEFNFPLWIDHLPRAQQSRMVGLFAGLCASEGHNKRRKGNKYQTFDGKMAAVIFAHKSVRNAKLDYHDPEYELIAQGFRRTNSHVERKQPIATQMLLCMRRLVNRSSGEGRMIWGSIVLAFFFLDRCSEMWGPVNVDSSTGAERHHCVKAANVRLLNKFGEFTRSDCRDVIAVEIRFESHKGDRIGQGVSLRHYRANNTDLCPVRAAIDCLEARREWITDGRRSKVFLISTSATRTIKKTQRWRK